jgi:hypothetical protein
MRISCMDVRRLAQKMMALLSKTLTSLGVIYVHHGNKLHTWDVQSSVS